MDVKHVILIGIYLQKLCRVDAQTFNNSESKTIRMLKQTGPPSPMLHRWFFKQQHDLSGSPSYKHLYSNSFAWKHVDKPFPKMRAHFVPNNAEIKSNPILKNDGSIEKVNSLPGQWKTGFQSNLNKDMAILKVPFENSKIVGSTDQAIARQIESTLLPLVIDKNVQPQPNSNSNLMTHVATLNHDDQKQEILKSLTYISNPVSTIFSLRPFENGTKTNLNMILNETREPEVKSPLEKSSTHIQSDRLHLGQSRQDYAADSERIEKPKSRDLQMDLFNNMFTDTSLDLLLPSPEESNVKASTESTYIYPQKKTSRFNIHHIPNSVEAQNVDAKPVDASFYPPLPTKTGIKANTHSKTIGSPDNLTKPVQEQDTHDKHSNKRKYLTNIFTTHSWSYERSFMQGQHLNNLNSKDVEIRTDLSSNDIYGIPNKAIAKHDKHKQPYTLFNNLNGNVISFGSFMSNLFQRFLPVHTIKRTDFKVINTATPHYYGQDGHRWFNWQIHSNAGPVEQIPLSTAVQKNNNFGNKHGSAKLFSQQDNTSQGGLCSSCSVPLEMQLLNGFLKER